jgi:hypothetical protein
VGGDVLEQRVVSAFRVEIMRPKGGDKGKEPDVGQWERWVIYGLFKVHMSILSQAGMEK